MWLFSSRKARRTAPARRPCAYRPRLEALEDRCVPSAGALDPTFGSGAGYVATVLQTNSTVHAYGVAVQPDGKIIGVGDVRGGTDQIGLVRYNPNGSLDTSFGNGGIAVLTNNSAYHDAYDVALQPDGKIDVADGVATVYVGSVTWNVYQFNANGTLDTSFGNQGQATVSLPSSISVNNNYKPKFNDHGLYYSYCRLVVLPPAAGSTEGKIVLAGNVAGGTLLNSSQVYDGGMVGLARFNPGGSLDATFGNNGTVETALGDGTPATLGHFSRVTLQADGKIVASGVAGPAAPSDSNPRHFVVARYNANGSLDSSFGSNGIVTTQVAALGYQQAQAVIVQPSDGKIVAVGFARSAAPNNLLPPDWLDWALVRYNADGSLDSSFGSGGIVHTPENTGSAGANAAALGSDGNIIAAGGFNSSFAVGRYFTQATTVNGVTYAPGSLDPTFGNNGIATTSVVGGGSGVAIQPDGKIVVAASSNSQFEVVRLLPSEPQIGSFTASPNPVTSGSSLTLTASNISDGNPNSTITQVTFFYYDSTGTKQVLGYGTSDGLGDWALSFTVNLAPGTYTLFAQAEDSYGAFGDPLALTLTVQ
jgi:uncharacterized delta-60 repeat protein